MILSSGIEGHEEWILRKSKRQPGSGAVNRPGTVQKPWLSKRISDFLCIIQHHSKIGNLYC